MRTSNPPRDTIPSLATTSEEVGRLDTEIRRLEALVSMAPTPANEALLTLTRNTRASAQRALSLQSWIPAGLVLRSA